MDNDEFLITLNVPPSLEENIVDCLLSFEAEHGFSSLPVNAHSHKNEDLSIIEQVIGRQRKIRFQIYLAPPDVEKSIKLLTADFSGSSIDYWVQPVVNHETI